MSSKMRPEMDIKMELKWPMFKHLKETLISIDLAFFSLSSDFH